MSETLGEPAPESQKMSALAVLGMVALWAASIVVPFQIGEIGTSETLVVAMLAFSISGTLAFSLLWHPHAQRLSMAMAIGFGLVASLLGYFAALRLDTGKLVNPVFILIFPAQMLVLLIGLLPYLQSRLSTGSWSWNARSIFLHAWNNRIMLFCGLLAMVLLFAGASVARHFAEALDNDSVKAGLPQDAAFLSLLAGGFGLVIVLLRGAPGILSKLRAASGMIARFSVIALFLFSVALLAVIRLVGFERFSGMFTLTTTLLIPAVLGVLMTSAYLNDDRRLDEKPTISGSFTFLLQPLLVVLSAVACYALYLRIAQYGITPRRAVMAFAAGTLLLYCLGGLISMVFWSRWTEFCRRTRSLVTLTATGVVALSLTPIADPFVLSAASQYRLLAGGSVALADYDLSYLEKKLGKPGLETLARLRREPGELQAAEINRKIDALQRRYPLDSEVALTFASLEKVTAETFKDASRIILIPENLPLPKVMLGDSLGPFVSKASCALEDGPGCVVTAVNLTDGDGLEYLIALRESNAISELWMLERHGARVQQTRLLRPSNKLELWDELISGEFAAVPANHFDLRIGDEIVHLRDRRWPW